MARVHKGAGWMAYVALPTIPTGRGTRARVNAQTSPPSHASFWAFPSLSHRDGRPYAPSLEQPNRDPASPFWETRLAGRRAPTPAPSPLPLRRFSPDSPSKVARRINNILDNAAPAPGPRRPQISEGSFSGVPGRVCAFFLVFGFFVVRAARMRLRPHRHARGADPEPAPSATRWQQAKSKKKKQGNRGTAQAACGTPSPRLRLST